ncbi:hypothetical protein, partial [Thermoleptolyngbya sp. M55_K2018_002]|uniref:hypothetical protein n=1 Tax=Thermoleptolyngbya sp. M55_K2018_002 TaxID=2747808 RepID=UPI0025CCF86F
MERVLREVMGGEGGEGRTKREEGRTKREEGRTKREERRGKREERRGKKFHFSFFVFRFFHPLFTLQT